MAKKVLICTGGTGGHVYPAQVLADDLQQDKEIQVQFVGGLLSQNPWFNQGKYLYHNISCSPLKLKSLKLPLYLAKIALGVVQSLYYLYLQKPDVVVGFGSYHTFPMLVAAQLLKKKYYLHEQNRQMGRVNRLFAKKAKKVFTSFPNTQPEHLNHALVKMPMKSHKNRALNAVSFLAELGLNQLPIILVCGGSQGAVKLNQLFIEAIGKIKNPQFQVIHLIGKADDPEFYQSKYQAFGVPAFVKPFDERLHLMMQVSQFMVGRAGASIISEAIEFELPSVLVPYPYAQAHQVQNAHYFTQDVKGGIQIDQVALTPELLAHHIQQFLTDSVIQRYQDNIVRAKLSQTQPECHQALLRELGYE